MRSGKQNDVIESDRLMTRYQVRSMVLDTLLIAVAVVLTGLWYVILTG